MKKEYFSEEELEAFLNEVEEHDMHEAPFYLKQEIMKQAFLNGNIYEGKLSKMQKRKWIIYNCKVALAGAAAIFLLFSLPIGEWQMQKDDVNTINRVTDCIGLKSEGICNVLSDISDKIIIDYK